MAVKQFVVFFVVAGALCYFMFIRSKSAALSSIATGPSPLRSSPHFDNFVLFGQIDLNNLKEITRHKLQLSVELGNHVWLQDVESKYYTFQLSTRNYSGLVGRLSILAGDDYATAFWTHSFMVQNDIGAYRVDINAEETFGNIISQGHDFEGLYGSNDFHAHRLVIGAEGTDGSIISQRHLLDADLTSDEISNLRNKQRERAADFTSDEISNWRNKQRERAEIEQVVTHGSENYLSHLCQDTKCAGKSSIMPQEKIEVLKKEYSASIQKWHLAFLVTCFAMIQLLSALVHKSILLLEVSVLSSIQTPAATLSDTSHPSWQLYQSNALQTGRQFSDSLNSGDAHCTGNSSLEEAWHVAEQYLNEAIGNDSQGAYFSYNCTSPQAQQERHESASGRWNRDNAGRLIRQLWPEQLP